MMIFSCSAWLFNVPVIRSHIEKNDITEIEDVTSACEAGGECGSCHILIQLFIDQKQHKKVFEKTSGSEVAESENNKKGFWRKLFAGS